MMKLKRKWQRSLHMSGLTLLFFLSIILMMSAVFILVGS